MHRKVNEIRGIYEIPMFGRLLDERSSGIIDEDKRNKTWKKCISTWFQDESTDGPSIHAEIGVHILLLAKFAS